MSKEGGKVPGGNNPENPGGNPDPNPAPKEKETVAFETHQKLLSEKKKIASQNTDLQERVNAFEKEKSDAEIAKLESEGKYKEALKLKEDELTAEKAKYTHLNKEVTDGQKLSSFLKAVGGEVDSKYWGLIDLDNIKTSEGGVIDQDSVNQMSAKFVEQYGNEIVKKPNAAHLPNEAPKDGGTPLSHEAWKKLPLKEMKARRKDVV